MPSDANDPFFGSVPESLHLRNAPLIRVLGQVMFPRIVKVGEEAYIADFQEAIRHDYPNFSAEPLSGLEINMTAGMPQARPISTTIWRFLDAENNWRVSLAPDALTLEAITYSSRADFLARMEAVLMSLAATIRPAQVQRVGYRYVDRISDTASLDRLPELIRPELLGVLASNRFDSVDISMSELIAATAEGKLIARYGAAPKGVSHDPNMAPPVGVASWVLDVDSFAINPTPVGFHASEICAKLNKVAGRAYAFFRWAVTDEFLAHFGAENP